jgi:hypothetical protein
MANPDPSTNTVARNVLPPRLVVNAIREPSELKAGEVSLGLRTPSSGVIRCGFDPSEFMTYR